MFTQFCFSSALSTHFTMGNPGARWQHLPRFLQAMLSTHQQPSGLRQTTTCSPVTSGFPSLDLLFISENDDMHGVFGGGGRVKHLIPGTLRVHH